MQGAFGVECPICGVRSWIPGGLVEVRGRGDRIVQKPYQAVFINSDAIGYRTPEGSE